MLGRPGPGQDPGPSSPLSAPPTARPAPGECSKESGNPTSTTSGPLLLCHHWTPDLPLQASSWRRPFKDHGDPGSLLQASESKPSSSPVSQSRASLRALSWGGYSVSPETSVLHAGQPLRPWPPPGSRFTDLPGAALPRVCICPDGASKGQGWRGAGPSAASFPEITAMIPNTQGCPGRQTWEPGSSWGDSGHTPRGHPTPGSAPMSKAAPRQPTQPQAPDTPDPGLGPQEHPACPRKLAPSSQHGHLH